MVVSSAKLACTVLFTALLLMGCGKRQPPLPPVERVQQRTEALSGVQRGNQVLLSWPSPLRNAPNSSVQSIRRVDVYRLAEKLSAPLGLTEEEFANRSTIVGSVTYDQIKNAKGALVYADTLELGGEPARLRYAVRYVNASEQRAAFSNFLLIEPAARIAQAPTMGSGEKAETGITLNWQPPAANIDGSVPVNLLGYNVYRADETQSEVGATPLNNGLISGTQYVDRSFKFGNDYKYLVRGVSLGTEGAQVESLNSNVVTVSPRDIYPPAAPGPVRLNVSPTPPVLSIFFPANQEADVAGYNLYRSTDPALPKKQWTKLNGPLLTKTTFTDAKVEPGKTYYYYVTAVDQSGNISDPSEVASETVP
jgi:predicted phage tail protein